MTPLIERTRRPSLPGAYLAVLIAALVVVAVGFWLATDNNAGTNSLATDEKALATTYIRACNGTSLRAALKGRVSVDDLPVPPTEAPEGASPTAFPPLGRIEAPSPRHASVADRSYVDALGLV